MGKLEEVPALKLLPALTRDDIEELLLEKLPHGSGIDCKWEFEWLKNGKLLAKNSYHCMNDNGYYVGFADFTVIFQKPITDSSLFDLVFNGKQAQRYNERLYLREYLEEAIYYAVTQ